MVIHDFIVKVVSRCNLNCSYCYMYNMGDTTYKKQPKFMSVDVIRAVGEKIKKHCLVNNSVGVSIIFHGGEPLLAGMQYYIEIMSILKPMLNELDITYGLQSNGTLLTKEWCTLLNELEIQVGISIDGPKLFHDKYRVFHNNNGSYNQVIRGIKIRDKYSIGGLISVINIDIPPQELYDFYVSINTKTVNILLPDNTYDQLPIGKTGYFTEEDTKYGDWLVDLYNIWSNHENPSRPRIPFFESIMHLILGNTRKGDELIGKKINGAVTIETDGAIEIVDPLRICGNGFTRNKLNVLTNEISEIETLPLFKEYYYSHQNLCKQCLKCPIQNVCGGGYLGHRFSSKNRFDNPTIYCNDLIKIITHIQSDIRKRLPEEILNKIQLESTSYKEIFDFLSLS